jgi:hypothetical protein
VGDRRGPRIQRLTKQLGRRGHRLGGPRHRERKQLVSSMLTACTGVATGN